MGSCRGIGPSGLAIALSQIRVYRFSVTSHRAVGNNRANGVRWPLPCRPDHRHDASLQAQRRRSRIRAVRRDLSPVNPQQNRECTFSLGNPALLRVPPPLLFENPVGASDAGRVVSLVDDGSAAFSLEVVSKPPGMCHNPGFPGFNLDFSRVGDRFTNRRLQEPWASALRLMDNPAFISRQPGFESGSTNFPELCWVSLRTAR